jgi:hypothetical protein
MSRLKRDSLPNFHGRANYEHEQKPRHLIGQTAITWPLHEKISLKKSGKGSLEVFYAP